MENKIIEEIVLSFGGENKAELREELYKLRPDCRCEESKSSIKLIPISFIKKTVCNYFGISEIELTEQTRKGEIVRARHIAMYFSKEYTKLSLYTIGWEIGKKNHSSVLHAIKKVNEFMVVYKNYYNDIQAIKTKLDEYGES